MSLWTRIDSKRGFMKGGNRMEQSRYNALCEIQRDAEITDAKIETNKRIWQKVTNHGFEFAR